MAIQFSDIEVYTTRPKTHRLHYKGSNAYFIRGMLLPDDTKEKFEEVAINDIPKEDEEEIQI